jgi:predicted  nucleic acid-binding Zn-ribbon protein
MAKKKETKITREIKQSVAENETEVAEIKTSSEESNEEITIAQRLLSLYNLQQLWSKIDKIRVIRGELPDEVRDLEDALEGMQTRIANYNEDIQTLLNNILGEENKMKDALLLIKRYEEQQNNVRNNREYESLSKEIEYQKLEIQVAEKRKGKFQLEIENKKNEIVSCEERFKEIDDVLQQKKNELDDIIADTEKEEKELLAKIKEYKSKVNERLLTAFERIRKNARNGLAVVQIDRDACGGCFSMIPPQKQMDIRLHKKIIVCEACGRIFVDKQLIETHHVENKDVDL